LKIGAPRDLEYLEQAQQSDVMFLRIGLGVKYCAARTILETQQGADTLAQRIFVADHGT